MAPGTLAAKTPLTDANRIGNPEWSMTSGSAAEDIDELQPLVAPKPGHLGNDARSNAAAATIYMAAFAQAGQGPANLATQYLLKDYFGFGPADSAYWLSFHSIGWVIKPLWGFISDCYPIMGEHRRPYMIVVSTIGSCGFFFYGYVTSIHQFVAILILTNACMSFLSVIAQALLVQRSGTETLHVASFNFSSYFVVKLTCVAICTYGAGLALERMTARRVLMLIAVLFGPVLVVSPWMKETPSAAALRPLEQMAIVRRLYARKEVWGTTLYIFVFCSMPNAASAMFFFNIDVLHFSESFIAIISLCASAAAVFGLVLYHNFFSEVSFRPLFGVATLACVVLSLTPLIQVFRINRQWGIDDHVFALVDTFIITAVIEVLWIPMLVLASRLCPKKVEGTTYALFLSIHNLGLWASGVLSWALTRALGVSRDNLENLWMLIVLCSLSMLIPLCLLPVVPAGDPETLRDLSREVATLSTETLTSAEINSK